MTFSLTGLVVSLAVLAPTLLLPRLLPLDAPLPAPRVSWVWTLLERVGQASCVVLPALSGPSPAVNAWFWMMIGSVAAYWLLWVRYLARGRLLRHLFGPLGPIPIPLALTPVAAFASAGLWLGSWWLLAAAAVLAAGHWPSSWSRARDLDRTQPSRV